MNNEKQIQIEKAVADAITQKPISFSVIKEVPDTKIESVTTKVRIVKWLPIYRSITEQKEVKSVKQERYDFTIAPPTIGKMQLLSNLYLDLKIDEKDLEANPTTTVMEICAHKTDICAKMMAMATLTSPDDLLNDAKVKERAEFFKWNCQPNDMSLVILALIAFVDYENFLNSIALTKILRQNGSTPKIATEAVEK